MPTGHIMLIRIILHYANKVFSSLLLMYFAKINVQNQAIELIILHISSMNIFISFRYKMQMNFVLRARYAISI